MIEDNQQNRLALLNLCRGDIKAAKEAMDWLLSAPPFRPNVLHVDYALQCWAEAGNRISQH